MSCRPIFAILLLAVAPVFPQAPPPQTQEERLLGGPCGNVDEGLDLWLRLGQAEKGGDAAALVSLQRLSVRARCDIEDRWLSLAKAFQAANRPAEAVEILQLVHSRGSNEVDRLLHDPTSPLSALTTNPAYLKSSLAIRIAETRKALDTRRGAARTRLTGTTRPPARMVIKPACPGEYCHLGPWSVVKDTPLWFGPNVSRQVALARKGQQVTALAGEAHVRPRPVLVVRHTDFAPEGAIVFLLNYLSEGSGNVWVDGKTVSAEWIGVAENCAFPGNGIVCWGEYLSPPTESPDAPQHPYDDGWWVRIRLPGGQIGWTNQGGNFDQGTWKVP